jgi:hypothetical protein
MGFKFRKRIKIAPGVHVNVSKRGLSANVGKKGASVTVGGARGTTANVGIPGTGISYSEKIGGEADKKAQNAQAPVAGWLIIIAIVIGATILLL